MKKILWLAVLVTAASCEKEAMRESVAGRSTLLRSSDSDVELCVYGAVDEDATKSAIVSETVPDGIYDLNVWQYSATGKLLGTFFTDEPASAGSYSRISFKTDIVSTDRFYVIANAGSALAAPSTYSGTAAFTYDYATMNAMSGKKGILAANACSVYENGESYNWEGIVHLKRLMARHDIRFQLDDNWDVYGFGTAGGSHPITVHDLAIHRAATKYSLRPSDTTLPRTQKAASSSELADNGDYYSGMIYGISDGSMLTPYYSVYTLPNNRDLAPSAPWYTRTDDYRLLTYASAIVSVSDEVDVYIGSDLCKYSAGDIGIRFLPEGESARLGIAGGTNYRTTVTIGASDDGINSYYGRRIDSRFKVPASTNVEVGTDIEISLAQPRSSGAWPYLSLSPTSVIKNDGVFGITDTYSASAYGDTSVSLSAISPGESTLYLKIPFEGKYLTGSIKLTAYKKTVIDVGGDDDGGGGNNEYD